MIEHGQMHSGGHIASAYSNSIVGTGFLAYRDLEALIQQYVKGKCALDFGCGRGRSSQFLMSLGFDVEGIDICPSMIAQAKKHCVEANFFLAEEFHHTGQNNNQYDLVLAQLLLVELNCISVLDVVLKQQFDALKPGGILIHTTTSDDFLKHQWTNIDTRFEGNEFIKNGEAGRIKLTNRHLELESFCWEKDFLLNKFKEHGFTLLKLHQPLGSKSDPYLWQDELTYSPYNIYILQRP